MKKLNVFMPFNLSSTALYDWCGRASRSTKTADVLAKYMSKDPGATDWSSLGLVCPIEDGSPVHDLDGTARVICFQFNERILPASVRDEKLRDEIKRIGEKEDRELSKKEYAEIKEAVEFKLLPKAFIRRSLVPVLVYPRHMLIFTSSAKKCEDVITAISVLAAARKVEFEYHPIDTKSTISDFLGTVVREGTTIDDGEDSPYLFSALNAVVFKGGDKRAIRIKDRDVDSKEVQSIVSQDGYAVTELAMNFFDTDAGASVMRFTLTDRFIIKGIKLSDVTMAGIEDSRNDRHTTAWLTAKTCKVMLDHLTVALNEGAEHDGSDEL